MQILFHCFFEIKTPIYIMNNNLFLNITGLFLTVKKRCNVQNMNTSSIHCPSAFVMFLICDQSVLSVTQIYYQYAAILSKTC